MEKAEMMKETGMMKLSLNRITDDEKRNELLEKLKCSKSEEERIALLKEYDVMPEEELKKLPKKDREMIPVEELKKVAGGEYLGGHETGNICPCCGAYLYFIDNEYGMIMYCPECEEIIWYLTSDGYYSIYD